MPSSFFCFVLECPWPNSLVSEISELLDPKCMDCLFLVSAFVLVLEFLERLSILRILSFCAVTIYSWYVLYRRIFLVPSLRLL